jgi:hypothetical protein
MRTAFRILVGILATAAMLLPAGYMMGPCGPVFDRDIVFPVKEKSPVPASSLTSAQGASKKQ